MENFPQSEFFEKSKHPIFTNSRNQVSEIQIPKSNIFEFPAFGFFHILVFGIQFSKKYFFEKLTFTKNLFHRVSRPCLENDASVLKLHS